MLIAPGFVVEKGDAMSDQKGSRTPAGERRQGDRRRNAGMDFGIADRRKGERRDEAAEDPSRAALARLGRYSR